MGEIKERLIEKTKTAIQDKEIAIKKAAEEIKVLEADIKVEVELLRNIRVKLDQNKSSKELKDMFWRQEARLHILKDTLPWQKNILRNLKTDRILLNHKKEILINRDWLF